MGKLGIIFTILATSLSLAPIVDTASLHQGIAVKCLPQFIKQEGGYDV